MHPKTIGPVVDIKKSFYHCCWVNIGRVCNSVLILSSNADDTFALCYHCMQNTGSKSTGVKISKFLFNFGLRRSTLYWIRFRIKLHCEYLNNAFFESIYRNSIFVGKSAKHAKELLPVKILLAFGWKEKNWVSERCSKEKCVAFGRLCIPQIPPNRLQDPGYVCILHPFLPAALPLFLPPKSRVPDFTSFFATRFAAVQLGWEGILTNGRTDTEQRQYRPGQHKLLPWGWDKMPDYASTMS